MASTQTKTDLVDAIQFKWNSVRNRVTVRLTHPSYGVKKADLIAEYNQLLGLLYAYGVVANDEISAQFTLQAVEVADSLALDLDQLARLVHGS